MSRRKQAEQRFWEKVAVGEDDECWLWTGSKVGTMGYGGFWAEGRPERAHRFSYKLFYGIHDKTLRVLHRCDNPPCVNPLHLFLGTQSDNLKDAVRKGRILVPPPPQTRLTPADVRTIRSLFVDSHLSCRELAGQFGVSCVSIRNIIKGVTWKHV